MGTWMRLDIAGSVSTATHQLKPRLAADPRRWSAQVGSLSFRLPPSLVSLLSGLRTDWTSDCSSPNHWLNHLCGLLSCFLWEWKVSATKRATACDPSFPDRSAACYCRFSPALTSGFCWITKHSRLMCAFIPVWSGTEQRVPPCPHCADSERDTVMRQEGEAVLNQNKCTWAQADFI